MSWLAVIIILGIQAVVLLWLLLNIVNAENSIASVRDWTAALPKELSKNNMTITAMLDSFQGHLVSFANHTKYVVACALLVLLTQITNDPTLYIPLWAGIGFSIESAMFLYRIYLMGNQLNHETDIASLKLSTMKSPKGKTIT